MKTEEIIDKNITLAIIIRDNSWEKGLNFVSEEKDFIQLGFWDYNKGQKLKAHIHLPAKRVIAKTQEVIFVKKGLVRADIFGEDKKIVVSLELRKGDTAVFLNGGHGYEILEDNTQVLEVKNGPYLGVEKDKKIFTD